MSDRPLLTVRNVRRKYDEFQLEVMKLHVPAGQVMALLGPTGSGKSTLLRLLGGLESPTTGELTFDGRKLDANSLDLITRRRITMVDQRPILLSGSVRYNVAFGLTLRGSQDGADKVDLVLEQLQLKPMEHQAARTLSGGQTQLVALARALVFEPDVLLLDEPTSHLDPAHVGVVEETVAALQQSRGTTIVWATHNLFQARRVASQTTFLLNGSVVETAETERFFVQPSDPRSADFVAGRMVC